MQSRSTSAKAVLFGKYQIEKVYLNPIIHGTDIQFEIKEGSYDEKALPGWNNRGNMTCPCCGNITPVDQVKQQFINKSTSEKLLVRIFESKTGKEYKLANNIVYDFTENNKVEYPSEIMPIHYSQAFPSCTWGFSKWGDIYSSRQLYMLSTFIKNLSKLKSEINTSEYHQALLTFLAIWFDRIAVANTSLGRWHISGEKLEHPFSRQAIAMVFDYPESNPFCNSSGSALNQLEWIIRYIESESNSPFAALLANASSGEKGQFAAKTLTAVVTDPPYYDAIGYADCSDLFYVWMKRTLGDVYPINFATPQTPKAEECTALKHHHHNSEAEAKNISKTN